MENTKSAIQPAVRAFRDLGAALLDAKDDEATLEKAVESSLGWDCLPDLIAFAARLTDTLSSDAIAHIVQGHNRFRRFIPRMLCLLNVEGAKVAAPLIEATTLIESGAKHDQPKDFLSRTSKWHRQLDYQNAGDKRLLSSAGCFSVTRCLAEAIQAYWRSETGPSAGARS